VRTFVAGKLASAPRIIDAAEAYVHPVHLMSTAPSQTPTTVSLADEEAVRRVLVDTLFGLWAIVNNLTRLRPSQHERYRVTVFGSARTEPGHWVYEEVKQMCSALSAMNCDIITGGGPGLMQGANEGARAAQASQGVQSIGIRVHLPFEQNVNPFVEQAFEHATFFTRLHHFVLMSDAYIVAPGGLGTLLESMMIWQLLQVRHLFDMPGASGPHSAVTDTAVATSTQRGRSQMRFVRLRDE
jgi:predicted Rossmann-fold nucleotide-binding protein